MWRCDVLDENDAAKHLAAAWGPLDLTSGGTVVVWDEIDKLPTSTGGLRSTLRQLAKRLELHLGLCFHRFLEARSLAIFIDQQTVGQPNHSIRVDVKPLNPFAYPVSGRSDYPKKFRASLNGLGVLNLEAHIWPPNSEQVQYKLGNKAAARQGFYFYRNGRLIQAGGWNGLIQLDTDPHSSLARVKIDLPTSMDSAFGLNVQKSAVIVPPGFDDAIACARTRDSSSFEEYRRTAQDVYRHQDMRAKKRQPLIPTAGIPKRLAATLKSALLPKGGRGRDVGFEWKRLAPADFFYIDRKRRVIVMNSDYRGRLLRRSHAHQMDLPLLKTMLFLILSEHIDVDKVSTKKKMHLNLVNELLRSAASD